MVTPFSLSEKGVTVLGWNFHSNTVRTFSFALDYTENEWRATIHRHSNAARRLE